MSKNAPKIILVVVCLGAAAGLLYYNMSGSNNQNLGGADGNVVGTSQEETDAINENLDDEEAPALQGLVKPNF